MLKIKEKIFAKYNIDGNIEFLNMTERQQYCFFLLIDWQKKLNLYNIETYDNYFELIEIAKNK